MTAGERAERARAKRAGAGEGSDEVLVGRASSIFDRLDARLVRSGAIAAALFGIVDLHAQLSHALFLTVDVALRIFAAAASIRFAVRLIRALRAHVLEGDPKRHAIVLDDDALVLLDGDDARVLPKPSVAAVVEDPPRGSAIGSVSLIVRGDGPCLVVLPTPLARPAAATARRLERYLGPVVLPEHHVHPAPDASPTRTFDEAEAGRPPVGATTMRRTLGWLLEGPYAGVVIVLVLGVRAASGELVLEPPLIATAALCLLLPGMWLVRGMRMRTSKLAFVATPAELLVRSQGGVHRFPWPEVVRVDTVDRRTWNVLTGLTRSRAVVVEREDGTQIVFDERELPVAAYHVRALFEAYLDGLVPDPPSSGTPPSHGTGGGSGISSDVGTSTNAITRDSPEASTTGDAHDAP